MQANVEPALHRERRADGKRMRGVEPHRNQNLRRNLEGLWRDQRFSTIACRFRILIRFARAPLPTTTTSFLLPLRRNFGSAGGGLGEGWGRTPPDADVAGVFGRQFVHLLEVAVGRIFRALIARKTADKSARFTLDLDLSDAAEREPLLKQRGKIHSIGREDQRLQHDRLPLEYAVIVALHPQWRPACLGHHRHGHIGFV
jgi:hypothetical protein